MRAHERAVKIAGLCKGSTADSDSVCEGSNPSPAAKQRIPEILDITRVSGILISLWHIRGKAENSTLHHIRWWKWWWKFPVHLNIIGLNYNVYNQRAAFEVFSSGAKKSRPPKNRGPRLIVLVFCALRPRTHEG